MLAYAESFNYLTNPAQRFTGVNMTVTPGSGRLGGGSAGIVGTIGTNNLLFGPTVGSNWIFGCAFKTGPNTNSAVQPAPLFGVLGGPLLNIVLFQAWLEGDNHLGFTPFGGGIFGRGAGVVRSTAVVRSPQNWHYIEVVWTAGQVYLDGVLVALEATLPANGLATSPFIFYLGGTAFFRGGQAEIFYSDLYIVDSTNGGLNTTRLGDSRVVNFLPSGAGSSTQLTATGAGTNWQAVADYTHPDDDTSYVANTAGGQEDLYAVPALNAQAALPSAGSVPGVSAKMRARSDTTATTGLAAATKSGSTTSTFDEGTIATTYAYLPDQVQETDPATSGAWSLTSVVAAQFGISVS